MAIIVLVHGIATFATHRNSKRSLLSPSAMDITERESTGKHAAGTSERG